LLSPSEKYELYGPGVAGASDLSGKHRQLVAQDSDLDVSGVWRQA
jgi:hypothetical protein